MITRKIRRLVVAAVAAATTVVAPLSVPAQATTPGSDCPSGYVCGWADTGATGAMMKTRVNMPTMGTWSNRIRSYMNRTSSIACLYDGADYTGTFAGIMPGDGPTTYDSSLDRLISSIKLVPNSRECSSPPYSDWYADQRSGTTGFGDLNGDRRADMLSRDRSGRLWFVSGTGAGTLLGSGWNAMTVLTRHGDLSGDSAEDLLARDSAGTLWLYPGTGRGAFAPRKKIGGGWNAMATITAVGDLTGDGHGDVLARDKTGRLWLYPGNGRGWFGARKQIGNGWQVMNAMTGPGDLTSDSRGDVLARDSAGRLWLYPGTGHGTLGARRLVGGGWGVMSMFLSVGDVNADGLGDLVAATQDGYNNPKADESSNALRLYAGNGKGWFAAPLTISLNWYDLGGAF